MFTAEGDLMPSIDRASLAANDERSETIVKLESHRDNILDAFERTEKRIITCSFLMVKIVSYLAWVAALILLEAGVLRQIWKIEFPKDHGTPLPAITCAQPAITNAPH